MFRCYAKETDQLKEEQHGHTCILVSIIGMNTERFTKLFGPLAHVWRSRLTAESAMLQPCWPALSSKFRVFSVEFFVWKGTECTRKAKIKRYPQTESDGAL